MEKCSVTGQRDIPYTRRDRAPASDVEDRILLENQFLPEALEAQTDTVKASVTSPRLVGRQAEGCHMKRTMLVPPKFRIFTIWV